MLYIGGENLHTVLRIGGDALAGGAETEQRQIHQRQAGSGDQRGQDRVARDPMRHVDAMVADSRGDHDAEHQRAQGIHGQVALEKALQQRRLPIGRSNAAANLAGGSEHRRASQQQQADNQYRGDHLADALEQPARIEDEKQHGGKIRQRIQPQRQGGVAGEGRHAHLERHHRGARGGEQRADGQIHRHGK
ncbi:hypothetical protein D3C81_1545870 [compost metagenome]